MAPGGVSNHLFFLFLVVTMGAALVALALSGVVFRRKSGHFVYLIPINCCIVINIFCNSVAVYLVTNLPGVDFNVVLTFFLSASYSLGPLTAIFPIYINTVLSVPHRREINIFFIIVTAALMLLYLHGLLLGATQIVPETMQLDYSPVIKAIFIVDAVIAIVYMGIGFFYGRNIKDPDLRKMIRSLIVTITLFTPGILIGMRIKLGIMHFHNDMIDNYVFSSLFFLTWNIVISYHFLRYLFYATPEPVIISPPDTFLQRYSISDRECAVIRLVAYGHSNSDIGDELSISTATVKSHLYNIYAKTGAKTRTELIRLIIENMDS